MIAAEGLKHMEQMEKKQQLFRQTSLDRVSSPEQLNDYIRVVNPGVWITLCAVLILLAALIVWSVFGTLPTTLEEACVADNGVLTCYLSDVSGVAAGQSVKIGDYKGTVHTISSMPYSSREVSQKYQDDYTVYMLGVEDWNYEVTILAPDVPDGMVEATIVTGEIEPARFILN